MSLFAPNNIDLTSPLAVANVGRDYRAYSAAMDSAESYKAGLIFPHIDLPEGGVVADIGSGTGALAERAALVFSHATVFALDQSHELLEMADAKRALVKLLYGDALTKVFADNSLDGAYSCSCGHEIETFGGSGSMRKLLGLMYTAFKPGATFVIRDFAKPDNTGPVYMLLSNAPAVNQPQQSIEAETVDDYRTLSDWQLFFKFHQEFNGGNAFEFEVVKRDGQQLLKLDPEWAYEFYMRKDYRINWNNEIKERYGYWTVEQAKQNAQDTGFEQVTVIPEHNQYIETNRLQGKVALLQEDSTGNLVPIKFPATHMMIVMKKPGELVANAISVGLPTAVDYDEILEQIGVNLKAKSVTVGQRSFGIETEPMIHGTKRDVFYLSDNPGQVLKIPRKDGINVHNCFKAMHQAISRQDVLREYEVPHVPILDYDRQGPPYRYLVQAALPAGAQSAADLILGGQLTETDIKQMAQIINRFESKCQWQLDTNPFNWYRVTDQLGQTTMTYADGKVYKYDQRWSFGRIGLVQWLVPDLLRDVAERCAKIPTAELVDDYPRWWNEQGPSVKYWQKYLIADLRPSGEPVKSGGLP